MTIYKSVCNNLNAKDFCECPLRNMWDYSKYFQHKSLFLARTYSCRAVTFLFEHFNYFHSLYKFLF